MEGTPQPPGPQPPQPGPGEPPGPVNPASAGIVGDTPSTGNADLDRELEYRRTLEQERDAVKARNRELEAAAPGGLREAAYPSTRDAGAVAQEDELLRGNFEVDEEPGTDVGPGEVGWDGEEPVFVISVDEEGNRLVGHFARVEVTGGTLTDSAPAPVEV